MFAEFIVYLSVSLEYFLLAFLKAAHYLLDTAVFIKRSVNHKKFFTMPDILQGQGVKVAPAIGKVVYGIEHIGLTHAISAGKAIDLGVKFKVGFGDVLIIKE